MHSRPQGVIGACLILVAAVAWVCLSPPEPRRSAGTAETIPPAISRERAIDAASHAIPALQPVAMKDATLPAESAPLPEDFLKRILSPDGKTVTVSLPGGGSAKGKVSTLRRDADGPQFIEGSLTEPAPGRFMFQRQTVEGKAGSLVGFVLLDKGDTAWKILPTGEKGKPVLVKTTADAVICRALPAPEGPEEIPPTHPDNYPIPPDEHGVIQLQSLPGATAVVYLDFDGEERNFDSWGYINALPSGASNSQIYDVWKGVSEDYQPFRINITTVRAVYDAAPEGRRIQVVITPTTTAAPGAGGVAYVDSFNWSGEMVCWSFYSTGKNGVEVISHEVGHTLRLLHDGRTFPPEAYYLGHTGWAPIMGAGYYQTPSQWSKGEYPNADNTEDDLFIIANNNNNVGLRVDDHGAPFASATWMEITAAGAVSNEGVIETAADEDSFRFSTTGGTVSLGIDNVAAYPNLDLMAEILDSSGVVIATHDPAASMDALFSNLSLTAGDYFLRVSGIGKGDLASGYSDYASLGAYTITGTITGGVHADRFTIAENSANTTTVGTISPRADHGAGVPSFAIASGNTGGTFAIDPATGVITIASNSLLDFETLSTRWDDPATFELFISVTDSLGAATESIRTVVTISDANEAPAINPPAAVTITEHLSAGSLVTRVSATDPDRFDHVTYSITAGNTGGAFAVNPSTGAVTVAGVLHFETTAFYTLTLRATDNLTPANFVEATLSISLLDISEDYTTGTIVRTFFNGISGSTVPSLTGSPNFPGRPHSEAVLTSFDSGTAKGNSYGSTVRGYLIAPATGDYTFWLSADDAGELRLSTDANPANAVVLAAISSRTDPGDWTAYPVQQSAVVSLTAGQPYYIEARHKEDIEGDHIQVAWQGPGIPVREIIPGRWLSPYQENYAPWSADQDIVVRESADNGQRVGQVSFIEPDLGQSAAGFSITAGNEAGIFAINAFSGDITVANGAALAVGATHTLTVSISDNGSPPTMGSSTVTLHVLGLHEQLHAWWKLDESSGTTVNDSSGNGRQAALSGGGSWIVRGAANNALQLDGSNARFSYLGNNSLSGGTSFTAAAWVKVPVTHVADGILIQQQESGSTGHIGRYIVCVKANGKINFSLYGRDANNANEAYQFDITSSIAIKDGTWHHVACVRDGTSGRIYIDGTQRGSASGPVRQLDPVLTVAAGYDARNNNQFLDSAVDDVRIYADALGSQQLVRVAGTPKIAIANPAAATADLPAGVGLLLGAVGSDPNETVPGFSWSQVSGPGTVTFGNPASGETTALFSAPGTYILRATASDGVNSAAAELSVTSGAVSGPNIGPLVSAGPDAAAVVNITADLTGSVSDDGMPVSPGITSTTWSMVSGPGAVVFGNPASLATTATFSAAGQYELRLVADDGGLQTFDEVTITAELLDTIGVAATDATASETGPETATFTFTRGGSLVGDLTVDFILTGLAENGTDYTALPLSILIPGGETTATLTLTPSADLLVEGPETATLTLSAGDYDITSASAAVVIDDSNHDPAWTTSPIAGADAQEGAAYSGALAGLAGDPDGNPLVFSKAGGPDWLEVAADGTLSGTPGATDAGPNTFSVRVTDSGGLFADAALDVFVHFTNQAPAFTADPVTAAPAMAGIPYGGPSLADHATDPNLVQGDALSFSKLGGPAWLEVGSNGTLSGTPQASDLGPNVLSVRVSDIAGATADVDLQITVTETILHLDTNGMTPGSGAPASVTWDASAIWSAESDGVTSTWPWISGARAALSAGADSGAPAITVDGVVVIGGLAVEEGNPVLSGGTLSLAGPSVVFDIGSHTVIASDIIGNDLVKTGTGALELSGSVSLTSGATVSQGPLVFSGTLSGNLIVSSGASLAGGGTASGNVNISGSLAPGSGVGTLTTGPLVLQTGSAIEWQATDWTGAAGTGSDLIAASSLDLTAAASVNLTLKEESLANFTDNPATFTVLQSAAAITGFDAEKFHLDVSEFPQATGHWAVSMSGNDLVLEYTPLTPFEAWQLAEFGPDAGNPLISGELADPDGDGSPNLLEYALATNPNLATVTSIVRDMVNVSGTDYLRLTILKNPAATDLTYTVETTGDLSETGSWSATDTFIEEDTATTLIVRDTLAGPSRFIRLRVTR